VFLPSVSDTCFLEIPDFLVIFDQFIDPNQNHAMITVAKKAFLLLLFVFFTAFLYADEFKVISFESDPSDLSAQRFSRKDINDRNCAIIKVKTDLSGLSFNANKGIEGNVIEKTGEYWLYVSPGEKRIEVKKQDFIPLQFDLNRNIESGMVYVLILTSQDMFDKGNTTGFLLLISEPTDAEVWINGEYRGQTTFQNEFQQGQYSLRLVKEMYDPLETSFTIYPDSTLEISSTLMAAYSVVNIVSLPEDSAGIILDDKPLGAFTPFSAQITPGRHKLTLRKELFEPLTYEFDIEKGETRSLDLEMKPIFGIVNITSPADVEIFVDGNSVGKGSFSGRLPKGMHTIEGRKDSHHPHTEKIEIITGQNHVISLSPIPITGSLSVQSEPPKADIFIDGDPYGTTPRIINDLLVGNHVLELRMDGKEPVIRQITISEDTRTQASESLVAAAIVPVKPKKQEEQPGTQKQAESEPKAQTQKKEGFGHKGFYIKPFAKYSFGMAGMGNLYPFSQYNYSYERYNSDSRTYTYETNRIMPGKGFSYGGALGYYFNDYFGFEFEMNSFNGARKELTWDYAVASDTYNYVINELQTFQSKSLNYTASVLLALPTEYILFYSRIGAVLSNTKIRISMEIDDVYNYIPSGSSFWETETYQYFEEWEYTGPMSFGLKGGLGIDVKIADHFYWNLELTGQYLTFTPDNGSRLDAYEYENGQPVNIENSDYYTRIEFLEEYTVPADFDDIDKSQPRKVMECTYPFHSIGFVSGFKIKF